ncbi:MAG TPA: WxcM-like domain-containing protein [Candidatus Enterocola sp.]|nr:WxcM-like domain-containing protein [Candidatus Enterocola sp.]
MGTLEDKVIIIPRHLIRDDRGWFLKTLNGKEENLSQNVGEVYFTSAKQGKSKGAHYHIMAKEWFTLISGKAILKLEDIYSHDFLSISLESEHPITVYIPPYVAHEVVNNGSEDFILCAYTDLQYNSIDTIPYNLK